MLLRQTAPAAVLCHLWNRSSALLRGRCWRGLVWMAARNPGQVSTQNVNGERRSHEHGAHPETPVAMHAPPVRTRVWLAGIATISFGVMLASSHLVSIATVHLPRRVECFLPADLALNNCTVTGLSSRAKRSGVEGSADVLSSSLLQHNMAGSKTVSCRVN
jgi:hypothetical protein